MPDRLAILGSTGSIGTATLDVLRALPGRFDVVALSAHRNGELLERQAAEFKCTHAALCPGEHDLTALLDAAKPDVVVLAVVGSAGVRAALWCARHCRRLALANKEALVVAGHLVMPLAREHGCEVLPVDSEHSAIYQALLAGKRADVARVLLTASGGPFLDTPLDALPNVTPDQALRHPTWSMGRKVTVDSATMLNKALELVEACRLFSLDPPTVSVLVHPQSTVHSMVEYADGSTLAQLSPPDMRLPIAYALTAPDRAAASPARRFDWTQALTLDFRPLDFDRFPLMRLGYEIARYTSGTSGAALNAADEIAVDAFLAGALRFTDIETVVRRTVETEPEREACDLDHLLQSDTEARARARAFVAEVAVR